MFQVSFTGLEKLFTSAAIFFVENQILIVSLSLAVGLFFVWSKFASSFKKLFTASAVFVVENKPLIISLLLVAGLFFALWRFVPSPWSDFGLNAFTEIIGIIFTVFLVDQLLKKQERRRLFPLQAAAFKDVQSFVGGLATFWRNVYNWSGKGELPPPPEPPSMQDFLTLSYFNAILQRLNLDAEACVFPKRTWWQYLPQAENEFRILGEKILERHAAVLDPQAYRLVHKVVTGFLNPNIGLNMLQVSREVGGFGEPQEWEHIPEHLRHRLGRYYIVIEEHLKDLAALYEWYMQNESFYRVRDDVSNQQTAG